MSNTTINQEVINRAAELALELYNINKRREVIEKELLQLEGASQYHARTKSQPDSGD